MPGQKSTQTEREKNQTTKSNKTNNNMNSNNQDNEFSKEAHDAKAKSEIKSFFIVLCM